MEHFQLIQRLHTDVLKDKYGKIKAKVIKHTNKIRKAHLIDPKGISRTFALTFFPTKPQTNEIKIINQEIKEGGAIGKTFRKHKFQIRKNVLDVYIIELPTWLKKAFKTKSNFAKARISQFLAKKKSSTPISYGTVVEIYSPDFRPPIINNTDISQISASTKTLIKVKITINQIWNRIGKEKPSKNQEKQYNQAKKLSLPLVFKLKEKIKKEIKNK
jgi:hypothetical protein